MKIIKYFLTFIMLLLINCHLALANTDNNIVNFNKTGTITITLKDQIDNTPIENAKITIYQVATVNSINNNLAYSYHENIKNCEADLSNLLNQNLANEISECIDNTRIETQTILTNIDGIVKFDNLSLGLYLVTQTNQVSGYSAINPFLIAIPKEENNIWIYDIEASPKTDIIRLIDLSVEKRWNSGNKLETHPNSVIVELYKGKELIDTITLNDENNWTHTWKQIEKSDIYSVKEINVPEDYTDTYRQEENKFIITNTKTLVQTGFNNIIISLITILGLIFIIVGIILKKGKKYE